MDYAKLTNLNGIYIRQADDDRLTKDVLERLAHSPDALARQPYRGGAIRALMPALKERAKTLVELADSAAFLARAVPLPMEPKAAAALTTRGQGDVAGRSGGAGGDGFLSRGDRLQRCGRLPNEAG